jgi:hypothetical protein
VKLSKRVKQYSILFKDGKAAFEQGDAMLKYFYKCSFVVEFEGQRETT